MKVGLSFVRNSDLNKRVEVLEGFCTCYGEKSPWAQILLTTAKTEVTRVWRCALLLLSSPSAPGPTILVPAASPLAVALASPSLQLRTKAAHFHVGCGGCACSCSPTQGLTHT